MVDARTDVDDSAEPMRYRTAALGTLLGIAFLVGFCYRSGMSALFATAFFAIYFLILFGITRVRAELGPLTHGIPMLFGPFQLIVSAVGSQKIPAQTLIASAPHWTHTKGFQSQPMPAYLESFKLADRSGMDTRKLWKVCLLATTVSRHRHVLGVSGSQLQMGWTGSLAGQCCLQRDRAIAEATRWARCHIPQRDSLRPSIRVGGHCLAVTVSLVATASAYVSAGRLLFLFASLVSLLRQLVNQGATSQVWWHPSPIAKRFPLFLGLILGDFVLGSMWGIMGLLTGEPTYTFKNW